jgi:hypothetical protein
VLIWQTDHIVYNQVEPYGYFYGFTFPLAAAGAVLLARRAKSTGHVGSAFLVVWLAACIIFGILQPINVNRINAIFIPLLISIAVALDWLGRRTQWATPALVSILMLAFAAFNLAYHGAAYQQASSLKYRPGLMPAIHFASTMTDGPVCVTDEPGQPYIYVLFSERLAPSTYLGNIAYAPSPDAERRVRSLSRYTFGKQACPLQPLPAYVLVNKEIPPQLGNRYDYEFFGNYVVYYPKR